MESGGEDLEDIFEEYENNENEAVADNPENGLSTNDSGAVKIAPPKRIVRNPRLKFNADRLCGERGIPVLVDHFKDVKFKGAGHEKEDLDKLLSKLEHWTHRLFPSMKFEDCLTHIEKLGKKRPVQTCLRKIRLDMPILNNDFVKDNEDDDVQRNEDPEPEEIDAFDRLIGKSQDVSSVNVSMGENATDSISFFPSPVSNVAQTYVLGSSFGSSLTEEQKERMERNRMLAAERRKSRLDAVQQNTIESQAESHENVSNDQNFFDKLVSPSFNNQQHDQDIDCDSELKIIEDQDENSKKSALELNDESSEKLELDDLINLVDEDDITADKVSKALSPELRKSISNNADEIQDDIKNFENNDCVSVAGNSDKGSSSLKECEIMPEENLGVESLLNLVSEASRDSKDESHTNCFVKDILVSDADNKTTLLSFNKEFTTVDCEDENSTIIVNKSFIFP